MGGVGGVFFRPAASITSSTVCWLVLKEGEVRAGSACEGEGGGGRAVHSMLAKSQSPHSPTMTVPSLATLVAHHCALLLLWSLVQLLGGAVASVAFRITHEGVEFEDQKPVPESDNLIHHHPVPAQQTRR